MYDNIKWEEKCPHCGNIIDDFQSKDGPCAMFMLDYWDVKNFYSSCNKCGTSIEYTKKRERKVSIERFKRKVKIKHYIDIVKDSKKFWEDIKKNK